VKIKYDLFPAHVAAATPSLLEDPLTLSSSPATEGAYYISTARVIVTDTRILIAQDSPKGASVIFNEPYDFNNFYKSTKPELDSILITQSGKVLAFKKDTNCGCGSRLRSWNPYKTLISIKDI
jgi:hypothetical protein